MHSCLFCYDFFNQNNGLLFQVTWIFTVLYYSTDEWHLVFMLFFLSPLPCVTLCYLVLPCVTLCYLV